MAIGITDWGLGPEHDGAQVLGARTSRNGTRTVTVERGPRWQMPRIDRRERGEKDQAGRWLRGAMLALGLLAAAAAVVSFAAQYHMVYAAKGVQVVAALEAGIPDTAAVVFAALGIALALHGKRALRPRALNLAAVATSIFMNFAAAAGTNWRTVAIWVMPSIAYAVASDTAIGVIRAYTIARQRQLDEGLADEGATPLDVLGGFLLWVLRLSLAPASTLTGFRAWVVTSCPVAPGTRAQIPAPQNVAALPAASTTPGSAAPAMCPVMSAPGPDGWRCGRAMPCPDHPLPQGKAPRKPRNTGTRQRGPSKTARFMDLVAAEYPGGLGTIDPRNVSYLCSVLAPRVDLDAGAARSYLTPRVREAMNARTEADLSAADDEAAAGWRAQNVAPPSFDHLTEADMDDLTADAEAGR